MAYTIQNNLYHNYGGGTEVTAGNFQGDTNPTHADPLLSGFNYTLASNSPAFSSPVSFPPIVGSWGPPGFAIPQTGQPPSSQLTALLVTGTTLTLTNNSGASQSNLMFAHVIPMRETDYVLGKRFNVYNGATPLPIQQDNSSTDIANGAVRLMTVSGVYNGAALASGASSALTIKLENGMPDTGAAIAVADLLAQSDLQCAITLVDDAGTTWTQDLRNVLNTYSVSWTAANTNQNGPYLRGQPRSGPYVTEWVFSAPVVNLGANHAQLRVGYIVTAWKAASGAVSGGNPILGVRIDTCFYNGWLRIANPGDYFYGVKITVGAASPVAVTDTISGLSSDYSIDATPTGTLTLGYTTRTTSGTVAASSGTVTISGGTASGVVQGFIGPGVNPDLIGFGSATPGNCTSWARVVHVNSATSLLINKGVTIVAGTPYCIVSSLATASRSAGSWTINDHGKTLNANGAIATVGGADIVKVLTATTLRVRLNINNGFVGNSLTSGTWRHLPIGHWWGAKWRARVWWSPGAGSAYNGDTWSDLKSDQWLWSKMIPNYGTSPSIVITDTATDNPAGRKPLHYSNNSSGDMFMDSNFCFQATTGQTYNDHLGINAAFCVKQILKPAATQRTVMSLNAEAVATYAQYQFDENTGAPVDPNNCAPAHTGVDLTTSSLSAYQTGSGTFAGTTIANVATAYPSGGAGNYYFNTQIPWQIDSGNSHGPDTNSIYIPYLITADFWFLETMLGKVGWDWLEKDPATLGYGINRFHTLGEGTTAGPTTQVHVGGGMSQGRGRAWCLRNLMHAVAVTPDSATQGGLLGCSKATMNTRMNNHSLYEFTYLSATNFDASDQSATNGMRIINWGSDGNAPATEFTNQQDYNSIMITFWMSVFPHAQEMGLLNANGRASVAYFAAGTTSLVTRTGAEALNCPPFMVAPYYWLWRAGGGNGAQTNGVLINWADIYNCMANSQTWGINTLHGLTLTLSATTGTVASPITATLSGNYFVDGNGNQVNFNVGGWVHTTDGGKGQIIAITGKNTCTLRTDSTTPGGLAGAAFGGLSYLTPANINLPYPHPDVFPTTYVPGNYAATIQSAIGILQNIGAANADAARTAIDALMTQQNINNSSNWPSTGPTSIDNTLIQWYITKRAA